MQNCNWLVSLGVLGLLGGACGGDVSNAGAGDSTGEATGGEGGTADDGVDSGSSTGATATASIEILIDDRGIPHIFAATDEDALFGAGYQTAVDRLYQMEMLRRLLTGRLSEVLGQTGFAQDQQLRIFDVGRWGAEDAIVMREQDPELAELISAWREGVNARIAEINDGEAERPFGYREQDHDFWPEPWTEDDPYVLLKGVELGLGRTVEFEIALTLLSSLFPEPVAAVQPFRPAHAVFGLPPEDRPPPSQDAPRPPTIVPPPIPSPYSNETIAETFAALQKFVDNQPGFAASNNWAVAGEHTASGRPIIAGDPHLDFALMGSMMPMHINSADAGGTINVAGFAQPGVPGIALGHTDRVAWTQTTAFGDVMDVWEVHVSGGNVSIGGESVAISPREETFTIRSPNGPVGEGSTATVVYDDVDGHGTILPQNLIPIPIGGPYLVDWMGYRPQTTRWPLILDTMTDLDDFEAALDAMPELNQSVVAADATGIAYGIGLAVPLREIGGALTPWLAMDGDDPSTLWTGELIPSDLLPRSRDPERGFIVTANNDPYGFTENGRFDDDPFYYGAFFAPGYRAKRIEDTLLSLTQRGDIEVEEMQALQMDVHSIMADDLVPLIAAAWEAAAQDEALAEFADNEDVATLVTLLSEDWDRAMTRESAGALAFQAFVHSAMSEVIEDDIGLGYTFAVELQSVFMMKISDNALRRVYPDSDVVLQGGADRIVLAALVRTADFLNSAFGSVDPAGYAWSDRKVINFDDSLGYGMDVFTFPTGGGEDTVNVSENIPFLPNSEQWASTWVAAERSVMTFEEDGTPVAYINYPVASHADPDSEHTKKAIDDYIEGRYEKLLFSRAEIEAATIDRIELTRE